MHIIRQTDTFASWLFHLKDLRGKAAIILRLRRLQAGNLGDVKSVGDGVTELRMDVGPGYRVYFTRRGKEIVLILAGGDKSSQARDIALAKKLAIQAKGV